GNGAPLDVPPKRIRPRRKRCSGGGKGMGASRGSACGPGLPVELDPVLYDLKPPLPQRVVFRDPRPVTYPLAGAEYAHADHIDAMDLAARGLLLLLRFAGRLGHASGRLDAGFAGLGVRT